MSLSAACCVLVIDSTVVIAPMTRADECLQRTRGSCRDQLPRVAHKARASVARAPIRCTGRDRIHLDDGRGLILCPKACGTRLEVSAPASAKPRTTIQRTLTEVRIPAARDCIRRRSCRAQRTRVVPLTLRLASGRRMRSIQPQADPLAVTSFSHPPQAATVPDIARCPALETRFCLWKTAPRPPSLLTTISAFERCSLFAGGHCPQPPRIVVGSTESDPLGHVLTGGNGSCACSLHRLRRSCARDFLRASRRQHERDLELINADTGARSSQASRDTTAA